MMKNSTLVFKPKQLTHTVRKDNTICWKSDYYSVPAGSYKGRGSVVVVKTDELHLIVSDLEGTEVCRHLLALGKGLTIKNSDHTRDKKPLIDEMIEQVCLMLDDPLHRKVNIPAGVGVTSISQARINHS